MRASTSAVHFAAAGQEATMGAARRIAALTHGDRAAWEGTAIFHELIRVTFEDTDPLAALPDVLALVHPTTAAATPPSSRPTGTPIRRPSSTVPSGPVWAPPSGPCAPPIASKTRYAQRSTWAVTGHRRRGDRRHRGAYYGLDAIPAHWTKPLHVPLPGFDGRVLYLPDLLHLAHRLGEGLSMRRV